jgi:hypothetical protein
MHGDEPVSLLHDSSHVRRIVLGKQDPNLSGKPLKIEEGRNGGGGLAGWTVLQHLRQHSRRFAVTEGRQMHHPVYCLVIGDRMESHE